MLGLFEVLKEIFGGQDKRRHTQGSATRTEEEVIASLPGEPGRVMRLSLSPSSH